MTSHRAPFLPLSSDIDDDRLEKLARDKGVGAMVKPKSAAGRAGEGPPSGSVPDTTTRASPRGTQPTPRSRMKAVNLELPDYVWTELKIRAAHQQTSLRHLIMTALRADGITIAEKDMIEDGRRLRGVHASS